MENESEDPQESRPPFSRRLTLFSSPVVKPSMKVSIASSDTTIVHSERSNSFNPELGGFGHRDGGLHDTPEFQRHTEATNLELFFDLFFAANLTVFSEAQTIVDTDKLISFLAYISMLWLTWLTVSLFDVRFVTDNVFERVSRTVHLGVMVGFAVVAPSFDPKGQNAGTFQTMSIILMVSRLALALQYAVMIWHTRKYRNTTLPLGMVIISHFAAAMVYLGLSFTFKEGSGSLSFITWYVIGFVETAINVGLSFCYKVLSFKGTHLTNRMSLLTLIIIGEGIIVVCSNVSTVVQNPNAWTPTTIGTVTAAAATIYFVFQIYFDWGIHSGHMPAVRQQIWSVLHFPFHIAMVLFVVGSSQYIIWWKLVEVSTSLLNGFTMAIAGSFLADARANVTTQAFIEFMNKTLTDVLTLYPPTYVDTYIDLDATLASLGNVSDQYWADRAAALLPDGSVGDLDPKWDATVEQLTNAVYQLLLTATNSLFASFKIDVFSTSGEKFNGNSGSFEETLFEQNNNRFILVFTYTFITAGLVLIFMTTFFVLSNKAKWTKLNIARVVIDYLIGLALGLTAINATTPDDEETFSVSPWVLPVLCLAFFAVLVINHTRHRPQWLMKRHMGGVGSMGSLGSTMKA